LGDNQPLAAHNPESDRISALVDCAWGEGESLRSICSAILAASRLPEVEWDALGGDRIVGLIKEGRLSEQTTIRLVDHAFKRRSISDPSLAPFGLDLKSLLSALRANEGYMEAIAAQGRQDKIDIAIVFLSDDFHSETPEAAASACEEFLSRSFEKVASAEPHRSKGDGTYLWFKYLTVAARFCLDVPKSLLDFADGDLGRRCAITARLSSCIKNYRRWTWADDAEKARLASFVERILLLLVDSDADDYVALWELAGLYESQDRLDEAAGCYYEASIALKNLGKADHESYCKLRMSLIKCQERECKKVALSGDKDLARAIAKGVYKLYGCLISYAESHDVNADGFKQGYARFQKDRRNFDGAYETIQSIKDCYRKNLELGMLHSSDNLERSRTGYRFLDYSKAVDCYARAWRALKDNGRLGDVRARMSVLYPLAHALYRGGRQQESYEVCRYAETVKHEPKVKALMKRLEDSCAYQIPVGQDVAIPALLAS